MPKLRTALDWDCELVKEPEYHPEDEDRHKQASCKLVFPQECTNSEDVPEEARKDFWVQNVCFRELAKQVKDLPLGTKLMGQGRLGANRWVGERDGNIHVSLHIISHNIMIDPGMGKVGTWLPGSASLPRKKKGDAEHIPIPSDALPENPPGAVRGTLQEFRLRALWAFERLCRWNHSIYNPDNRVHLTAYLPSG